MFSTYLKTAWLRRWFRPQRRRRQSRRLQLETLEDRSVPATFTWTGGSSENWSDAGNWNGGVPTNGDFNDLVFPASAGNQNMFDDILGLSMGTLIFQGGGYTLEGEALGLDFGIENLAGNNTLGLQIVLAGSGVSFDAQSNSVLNVAGPISMGQFGFLINEQTSVDGNGTVNFSDIVEGNNAFGLAALHGTVNFSGPIVGSIPVALASGPTVTLSGNNTYSGGTRIGPGTLIATNNSALGTGALSIEGGEFQASADITISNNFSGSGGAITGDSDVIFSGNGSISSGFGLKSTGTLTFNGNISGSGGPQTTANGTFIFNGANTFSGQSLFFFGDVQVNGTQTQSEVMLVGGTLGGTGTIGTMQAQGGAISPGGNGPGILSANGAVTLSQGVLLDIDINGTQPGSGYDQFRATGGGISLSDATLQVVLTANSLPPNSSFTIVSAPNVTGTFLGLPNGDTFQVSGLSFQIAYSSNAVTLTLVPASQRFISQLYRDFLFRTPDAGGLAHWSGLLHQGVSKEVVTLAILNSTEHRAHQVEALVHALLHRPATADEHARLGQFLTNGGSLDLARAEILGSQEYFRTRGRNDLNGFLAALSEDALGHADANTMIALALRLIRGALRQTVAEDLLRASEAREKVVRGYYQRLLERDSDATGLAFFTAVLGGASSDQVAAVITASPEYATVTATDKNSCYVTAVFEDLLNRQPTFFELAYWTNILDNNQSTTYSFVLQIQATNEYLMDVINAIYVDLLHRPVDPTGLSNWLAYLQGTGLQAPGTIEGVQSGVAGSTEYFMNRGGNSVAGFLNALWLDALDRLPSTQEQINFGTVLNNGSQTTAQVANTVFTSKEYYTDLVTSYYVEFLNRQPDMTGLDTFVAYLLSGNTNQVVVANIMASTEYYGNATKNC